MLSVLMTCLCVFFLDEAVDPDYGQYSAERPKERTGEPLAPDVVDETEFSADAADRFAAFQCRELVEKIKSTDDERDAEDRRPYFFLYFLQFMRVHGTSPI